METQATRGTLGISDHIQDTNWYDTIPTCIQEDMPFACRIGVQGTLGHFAVGKFRKMQMSKLEEWREKAYHNARIYKERTKKWHDKRIKVKEFKPGDKVLLFNSRFKLFGHGKLKSKWEGPYLVVNTATHGAITL